MKFDAEEFNKKIDLHHERMLELQNKVEKLITNSNKKKHELLAERVSLQKEYADLQKKIKAGLEVEQSNKIRNDIIHRYARLTEKYNDFVVWEAKEAKELINTSLEEVNKTNNLMKEGMIGQEEWIRLQKEMMRVYEEANKKELQRQKSFLRRLLWWKKKTKKE